MSKRRKNFENSSPQNGNEREQISILVISVFITNYGAHENTCCVEATTQTQGHHAGYTTIIDQ